MGTAFVRPPANDPIPVDLLRASGTCDVAAHDLASRAMGIAIALHHGVELAPVIKAARTAAHEARTIAAVMERLAETLALIDDRRTR